MLTPDQIERVIARALEMERAMSPADRRRERRRMRRALWRDRVRAWRAPWRRVPAREREDAAAVFMTTPDTYV